MSQPRFSFIIPVYQEGPALKLTLDRLHLIARPYEYEILICDDGCPTPLQFHHPRIQVIRNQTCLGIPTARSLASNLASGEIMVHLDAHCLLSENSLESIHHAIAANPYAVYGLPIGFTSDLAQFKRYAAETGEEWPQHGFGWRLHIARNVTVKPLEPYTDDFDGSRLVPAISAAAMAMTRVLYQRLGGFDRALLGTGRGDDLELCLCAWALGFQVRMLKHGRCMHFSDAEKTVAEWVRNHGQPLSRMAQNCYNLSHVAALHLPLALKPTLPEVGLNPLLSPGHTRRAFFVEPRRRRTREEVAQIMIDGPSNSENVLHPYRSIDAVLMIIDDARRVVPITSEKIQYLCLNLFSYEGALSRGVPIESVVPPPEHLWRSRQEIWEYYRKSAYTRTFGDRARPMLASLCDSVLEDAVVQYGSPEWMLEDSLIQIVKELQPKRFDLFISSHAERTLVESVMAALRISRL